MKREGYVVIGSNNGDEGKGLMVDYFCEQLIKGGHKEVLNVRFNGGAQAGHTVLRGVNRHIFHIIGSGSLLNKENDIKVHTYYTKECILNTSYNEYEEFRKAGYTYGTLFTHKDCRLTTYWDIELNRKREDKRGKHRHGSCGLGFFETIKRDEVVQFRVDDLYKGKEHIRNKLTLIVDYFKEKAKEAEISYDSVIITDEYIDKHVENIINFKELLVKVDDDSRILPMFTGIVFEGAQGLLLDMDNKEYFPHLTPSNTGTKNVVRCLNDSGITDMDLHVCYVTRSYNTRHGAGPLDYEVNDTLELGSNVYDNTNVYNAYQTNFRYGRLDYNLLIKRVHKDFEFCKELDARIKIFYELSITHLDQTNGYIRGNNCDITINRWRELEEFDRVYSSYGEKAINVKEENIEYN